MTSKISDASMVLSLRCAQDRLLPPLKPTSQGIVFQIELAERTLNVLKNSRCHRGEYGGASV